MKPPRCLTTGNGWGPLNTSKAGGRAKVAIHIDMALFVHPHPRFPDYKRIVSQLLIDNFPIDIGMSGIIFEVRMRVDGPDMATPPLTSFTLIDPENRIILGSSPIAHPFSSIGTGFITQPLTGAIATVAGPYTAQWLANGDIVWETAITLYEDGKAPLETQGP